MILVDTSVWIDFFRPLETPEAQFLTERLVQDEDICICGIILTEVLQGIRSDKEHRRVRKLLDPLIYLPTSKEAFVLAADLFRDGRSEGITIRRTIDCIIAACAIIHKVELLHRDRDFDRIAGFSELQTVLPG